MLQVMHASGDHRSAAQQWPADQDQASAAICTEPIVARDRTTRAAASQTDANCARAPADASALGVEHADEVAVVFLFYMMQI